MIVVRMSVSDMEVVVVECCGVNDCVMAGGSVEMPVARLACLCNHTQLYVIIHSNEIPYRTKVTKILRNEENFVRRICLSDGNIFRLSFAR